MSTVEQAVDLAQPIAVRKPRKRRPKFRDTWWRHLVGILALLFSLFPIAYVISAAFNRDGTLTGASLIPRHTTLDNFRNLFHGQKSGNTALASAHYLRWLGNSLLVASLTAILSVMLSAMAAYAFSRFRFRGRRVGMLSLMLVQMFPQLLLVVSIYLVVLHVGGVIHPLGLNSLTALVVVYLGGALGVGTWLMKGFFDTIPVELDESARVDGGTPGQVYWGVVLPLAAPVLAVIMLMSFVATFNEYVLASALWQSTQKFTLGLGMQQWVSQQYVTLWGPFTAGVLIAAVPAIVLFIGLQKYIVAGLTGGAVKG